MNNVELENICRSDTDISRYFLGVFPADRLPKNVPYPCCFIANTEPHNESGEHWVAFYIDAQKQATYFCSYGRAPKPVFDKWMKKNCDDSLCLSKRVQKLFSTACGQYCVCYLHFRSRSVANSVFLSLFTNNCDENDDIVTAFVNGIYNTNTTVVNDQFIVTQWNKMFN